MAGQDSYTLGPVQGEVRGKAVGRAQWKTHEIQPNVTELPLAQALRGNQEEKRAHIPQRRGLEHGYGEVTQRERRLRRAEGGGERRMQMCGALEKGGTMGNTTSYCLEREDRSGATREAAEDDSPEFIT